MKGNDLLKGLTYVDDSLIREAEEHKPKKSPIRFVLPVAASLAIIIAVFSIRSNYPNHLPLSPKTIFHLLWVTRASFRQGL